MADDVATRNIRIRTAVANAKTTLQSFHLIQAVAGSRAESRARNEPPHTRGHEDCGACAV